MRAELAESRGRVLVIGAKEGSEALLAHLSVSGYQWAITEDMQELASLAESLRPDAVLMSATGKKATEALSAVRQESRLREVRVLADLTRSRSEVLRKLPVDEWVRSLEELSSRLDSALRERRVMERTRNRMERLLEITQAATSSLELEQILRLAVEKVGAVINADRCSVVLVEDVNSRTASVVATLEDPGLSLDVDLARYPELRRALETRQPVLVEEAQRDPLMAEVRPTMTSLGVRSILVQPLVCSDELLGALFLRMSRGSEGFGRDEQEFAQAVAAALANCIRNARLHTALKKKRDELELAYVERYRELTEANRRLKDLNRLKDEIIAVCSHDLRAPLQVLLGHGRLLLEGGLDPQQKQSAEAMIRQGRKILGLVESLLERGKGDVARLSIEPRVLDISTLCKESVTELEILAAERGVALRAETSEIMMLIGDELKLHEVLQNLITNAIHHAQDAGEVVVKASRLPRPDGDVARIVVQDDGKGIPPEELPLVFDRYRSGAKGGGGTGLGLAICKEFVELHGGEIWAEAPPEGGAAFIFTLPLAQEVSRAVQNLPAKETAEQPRVLVVEDEPEIAAVLVEVLRSRYRVDVARDGAEGLARARTSKPDLVVMDVFLPKLDGLDAAVALKSSSDTANIPVILLSAHQGVADKVRALNLGAVDYMSKPFNAMELLGRTERALKLRKAENELERTSSLIRRSGNDPLTGVYDRRGLMLRLDHEVSRGRRYSRPVSLAVLRPDRPVLDEALRGIPDVMRARLRTQDILGHMGEGVLAVVLPECNVEAGRNVIGRLLPDVEKHTGMEYRSAVADVSHDSEPVERILERLGAPPPVPKL
ncbi:ATP-binding protein [Archangium violaceum]|uniref:histidine kinase n=1 Tax=Archangium violaceum Cb vi76 TaxID=1406225 RepID=A0A084T1N5_9BACT|nr:ATP-binding protein [Archangium violaceum]KFA94620.1 histidine kinase [Archangium violaceum Cb vi76]